MGLCWPAQCHRVQRLQRRPGRRLGIVAAQEKGLLRREYEVVLRAS